MKKILFVLAFVAATMAVFAQHNIILTDTVFVGSSQSYNTHESVEFAWSADIQCSIAVYPYFREESFTTFNANLPVSEYQIEVNLAEDEWFMFDTVTRSASLCDSDGFAFVIDEGLPTEDLIPFMAYRGETIYRVNYSGPIKSIRVTSSSSIINYNSLSIGEVTTHTDTITVMRVASMLDEGHPNPTTGAYYFNRAIEYVIINSIGQIVATGYDTFFDFSQNSLPMGIYWVVEKNTNNSTRVIYTR